MQYIIFHQIPTSRKDDINAYQNHIIENHDFPFDIPHGILCEFPFAIPHPTDEKKRLYFTTITTRNGKRNYGRLAAVIACMDDVYEIENKKSVFMLKSNISLDEPTNSSDIKNRLLRIQSCLITLKNSLQDSAFLEIVTELLLPRTLEAIQDVIKAIHEDFAYRTQEVKDIDNLVENGDLPITHIAVKRSLIDKQFIHQANKALMALDVEELEYLISNKMFNDCDEVVFLAINATKRLRQMFKDYNSLTFERTLHIEKILVDESLITLLNGYKRSFDVKHSGVRINVECKDPIAKFIASDFNVLSEVIETILYNAVEELSFIRDDREKIININVYQSQKEFFISFEDSGNGFSDLNNQEKYFSIGYTTKSENTGLGLSIAKEFMNKLQGTITLDKSAQLKGAKVILQLPIFYSHQQ